MGLLANADTEKANELNKFFKSVFTTENDYNIPNLSRRPTENSLDEINITYSEVLIF